MKTKHYNLLILFLVGATAINAQNNSRENASAACNSLTTMTDPRDGQVYNVVQIGTQWWMAQNLNYGTMVPYAANVSQTQPGQKYCYNNVNGKGGCSTYGGLYEFAEAVNFYGGSSNYTTDGDSIPTTEIQGVCPTGWHLPSDAEWCTMENFVEPKADTSCNNWFEKTDRFEGTNIGSDLRSTATDTAAWTTPVANGPTPNSVCFSALAAGVCNSGMFSDLGGYGYWWTSSENNVQTACNGPGQSVAWMRSIIYHSAGTLRSARFKNTGYSVRCVQNNITTSIKEQGNMKAIKIYPNPSNGNFTVESSSDQQQVLRLFDISGDLILTEAMQNGKTIISQTDLAAGIYDICITGANGILNKRMVIVK